MKIKQPAFMITFNFNGKNGITSFMSKDMSKEAITYLLGQQLGQFMEQSTANTDEFESAVDAFLTGLEDTMERVLGPVFGENKKVATEKIVADLRKKAGQSKKTTKKVPTKKKK